MSKDILFYSERCDYSMKIFSTLKDKTSILKICIDDPGIKLPTFVSAVPLIYIPSDKRVIVDDAVEMWIGSNFSAPGQQSQQQGQQSQPPGSTFKEDKEPSGDYYTSGFSFSSSFSALEGDDVNGLDGGCGFANLSDPLQSIETPTENGGKVDSNAIFEQFQQQRNKDVSSNGRR